MHWSMVAVNQADTTQRRQLTNFTERTVILKDVTFLEGLERGEELKHTNS